MLPGEELVRGEDRGMDPPRGYSAPCKGLKGLSQVCRYRGQSGERAYQCSIIRRLGARLQRRGDSPLHLLCSIYNPTSCSIPGILVPSGYRVEEREVAFKLTVFNVP
jgi:hypothetical protein